MGPTGPTGPIGPQGPVGLMGANISNYATLVNIEENNRVITSGNNIIFDSYLTKVGVTFTVNTSNFSVDSSGYYFLQYNISYISGQGSVLTLMINDASVPNTSRILEASSGYLSSIGIFYFNSTDVIAIKNYSGGDITLSRSPNLSSQLVVYKIG